MERNVNVTLFSLPGTLDELCRQWGKDVASNTKRESAKARGTFVLSLRDVGSSVLQYRAYNPSPTPNLRAIFRPLDVLLTVSYPNGSHSLVFKVRRNMDQEGLLLEIDSASVQESLGELPKHVQKEYLLSMCDFARSAGCERLCLPKHYCLLLLI